MMGAPLLGSQAGDGRPIAAHLSILLPSGDREAATVQGRAAAGRRGSVSDEPLSAATVLAVAICSLVPVGRASSRPFARVAHPLRRSFRQAKHVAVTDLIPFQ
jgi:hypothetical protein